MSLVLQQNMKFNSARLSFPKEVHLILSSMNDNFLYTLCVEK